MFGSKKIAYCGLPSRWVTKIRVCAYDTPEEVESAVSSPITIGEELWGEIYQHIAVDNKTSKIKTTVGSWLSWSLQNPDLSGAGGIYKASLLESGLCQDGVTPDWHEHDGEVYFAIDQQELIAYLLRGIRIATREEYVTVRV
jgi:hypothetical protein